MSSLDRFNILLERMETLDEMADSFKRTVKGAAGGEDGLNLMLRAYRNERTGKPVGAVSRVKNLIVLRALYDKDYINDAQFQALAKKATSSNYISNTLKEINPEAHDKLFGTAQESDDIIKHIKLNAKDMLNFGLTNLQGKNYVEVQEDEPEDPDAKELEDDVTSEVISLAKGLTSDDVEGTILDFDDVDVALDGLENKEAITRKLVSILNGAGYTAEATGAGFNVEAPIGSFGTEEKVQDLMAGLILKHFPGANESLIDVKLNTTIEDAEVFNGPDLPGEIAPELDPRAVGEELNRDREEQELKDEMDDRLHTPASDEEDSLEARVQAALSSGGIDKSDARDIQRNSDDAFENILSPAIETARQDPDMDYAEVKGMIESQLGRKCTEDECKDIKYDLYNMHGEEGDQERAEAVLNAEDAEGMENKYTVIENDEDGSIQPMSYRQPEGKLIKTVKSDGLIKRCYQHPEGREWTVESDKAIDFDQEGSWTWDEESNVEDAEGIAAGRFGEMDSEEDLIFDEMEDDFKNGMTKAVLEAKYGTERVKMYIKHIEGNETVTENFENQRHLNVTTNSTSMYLTEQVSKDKRNGSQNKKSSNQTQSFKERYKPKTHWQLEELRRYGL